MNRNTFVLLNIQSPRRIPPLGNIRIAAPCNAEWKWMYGDDRVRFCGQCSQNVFNLSAMTTEEAEDLIRRAEGRLCVRFYRRRDGSILTKNCPVGVQAIRDKLTSTRNHIIAAILGLLGYLGFLGAYELIDHEFDRANNTILNDERPRTSPTIWLKNPGPRTIMGAMLPPTCSPGLSLAIRSERFIRDRAIFKVMPVYHWTGSVRPQGDVVVRVIIDEDGTVDEAECIKGHTPLKELAEEAARQWKFEPVLVNGQPVEVESVLTFRFKR
jgi:TonB family protein